MDCLVTKLKGTVNDSSLPELGCLYFTLQNPSDKLVKIEAIGEDVEFFTPNGEAVFYSSSSKEGSGASKYAVTTSNTIFYVDASTKVRIGVRNKYALEKLDVYESEELTVDIDFNDFAYCKKLNILSFSTTQLSGDISALQNLTALTSINLNNTQVSGDISALQNLTALTSIGLSNTQVSGDISALQNLTALTSIGLNGLATSDITGNIELLKGLVSLTIFKIGGSEWTPYNELTGNFKNLCEGMKSAGRTSGTLTFWSGYSGCKFDEDTALPSGDVVATFSSTEISYSGID